MLNGLHLLQVVAVTTLPQLLLLLLSLLLCCHGVLWQKKGVMQGSGSGTHGDYCREKALPASVCLKDEGFCNV